MNVGGVPSSYTGLLRNYLLDQKVSANPDSSILLNVLAETSIGGNYIATFVNGVYVGKNYLIEADGTMQAVLPAPTSPTSISGIMVGSVLLVDGGLYPIFSSSQIPVNIALDYEALTATNILLSWNSVYSLTALRGGTVNAQSQLSNLSVIGAKRNYNISPGSSPQRGELTYSLITTDGTSVISWYMGNVLVSIGSITGSGSFTCLPITYSNNSSSNLTITGTLSYMEDVVIGNCILEIRFAQYYNIYINDVLTYKVIDQGNDSFSWLSTPQADGSYYWGVSSIDDDGIESPMPINGPLSINAPPQPVSNVIITKNDTNNFLVSWTNGESGDYYTIYSSLENQPVNFGDYSSPLPVITSIDATSAIVPLTTHIVVDGMNPLFRFVIRATNSSGVQENFDQQYDIEVDSSGNIVKSRPVNAFIQSYSIALGYVITVNVTAPMDPSTTLPSYIDIYAAPINDNYDFSSPIATITLPPSVSFFQFTGSATIDLTSIVGINNSIWYKITALARTVSGGISMDYTNTNVWFSNSLPPSPSLETGNVTSGGGTV